MVSHGALATFAAGCFWGTERYFKRRFKEAIISCEVGYMGGRDADHISYTQVKTGQTGHAEVLQLRYDENKVSFEELLDFFFRMHNPSTVNQQQGDIGTQYRSAIFYHNDIQKKLAEKMIADRNGADLVLREQFVKAFGDVKIVTTLEKAGRLYTAEEYHQMYLDKNPDGYCAHRIYW